MKTGAVSSKSTEHMGVARAWLGRGVGVAWAWHGRGLGRGRGLVMSRPTAPGKFMQNSQGSSAPLPQTALD